MYIVLFFSQTRYIVAQIEMFDVLTTVVFLNKKCLILERLFQDETFKVKTKV